MLIYTSKSPGWGKQKPRQYNLSHAQASVRDNADAFDIGIIDYFPLWEKAGTPNPLFGDIPYGYSYNTSWINAGLNINEGRLRLGGGDTLKRDFSVNFIHTDLNSYTDRDTIVSFHTGETNRIGYLEAYSSTQHYWYWNDYITNYEGDSYAKFVSIPDIIAGRKKNWCFQFYDDVHELFHEGELRGVSTTLSQPRLIPRDNFYMEFGYRLWTVDGNVNVDNILISDTLSTTQIAQLHDTPYALLQPVAPVFYSIPSSLIPQILYPENGDTGVSTTPTVSWSAVTGATKYKLQVDTADTFDTGNLIEEEITGGAGLLILDSHSAIAKAKQKPKQWGPLSSVQSAVKKNAEKLGINPKQIASFVPLWEGAKVIRDILSTPLVVNGCPTTGDGFLMAANDSRIIHTQSPNPLLSNFGAQGYGFTAFITFNHSGIDSEGYLFNRTKGGGIRTVAGGGDTEFYVWGNNSISLEPIRHANMCTLRFDGSETIDGYIDATNVAHQTYAPTGMTNNSLQIGNRLDKYESINNLEITQFFITEQLLSSLQISQLHEQPYRLLQPTTNRIISIGSATPATSKQVTLSPGTQYHARVAAEVL